MDAQGWKHAGAIQSDNARLINVLNFLFHKSWSVLPSEWLVQAPKRLPYC